MKTINVKITKEYTDNRKYNFFEGYGPLGNIGVLANETETSYLRIDYIDFKTGDIKLKNEDIIMHKDVVFKKEESYIITTICYDMKDDGIPCNKDTLVIKLRCYNEENKKEQIVYLDYEEGKEIKLKPYPYQVIVKKTNNEEVELVVNNDNKTTTHLVQLYNPKYQEDKWSYATGNPNDPVDTTGPTLYMELIRK